MLEENTNLCKSNRPISVGPSQTAVEFGPGTLEKQDPSDLALLSQGRALSPSRPREETDARGAPTRSYSPSASPVTQPGIWSLEDTKSPLGSGINKENATTATWKVSVLSSPLSFSDANEDGGRLRFKVTTAWA